LREIYALLGVSWQTVYKWSDPYSSSPAYDARMKTKHKLIRNAVNLFSLTHEQTRQLATKIGITVDFLQESESTTQSNEAFADHFNNLLLTYPHKESQLAKDALISERMFNHIKHGKHLSKNAILALLITMGLDSLNIQKALAKAGFTLSLAIPSDVVILWLLDNQAIPATGAKRLDFVNQTLDDLGLPLVESRE